MRHFVEVGTIRRYEARDFERVKEIHAAQGFDYPLPELAGPQIMLGAVIENGRGVDTALFLRKTAETFLMMSAGMTREQGLARIQALEDVIPPLAREMGLADVFCELPPQVQGRFAQLLARYGWTESRWPHYVRSL